MRSVTRILFLLAVLPALASAQASEAGLPDPLSLEQALASITETHPDLARQKLNINRSETDLEYADSLKSFRVIAEARARWTERKDTQVFTGNDDHRLALTLSKPLYDGGKSSALAAAAQLEIQAASLQYASARDQHVILVMQLFFEVILADLQTGSDLEAMSVAYVRMDKARDRHELGQLSDIDLLEYESIYQDARQKLYASEGVSRSARLSLALALDRPGQQPARLVPPKLEIGNAKLLPYEALMEKILAANYALQSKIKLLEAARARIAAARSASKPSVSGEIQRAEFSRDTSLSNRLRIGVEVEWPLYDGGATDIAIKRAQMAVTKAALDRRAMENDLRLQVRELTERIRSLRAGSDAARAYADFRELHLDRSRALYEMEVRTDLGDAMVEISRSQHRSAQQRFQLALSLAQLNALAGEPVTDLQALMLTKPANAGGQ